MLDPIVAVIIPRRALAALRGSSETSRPGGTVVHSPAFAALAALAREDRQMPLPRLDRVASDKARLMALAGARRTARLRPGAVAGAI